MDRIKKNNDFVLRLTTISRFTASYAHWIVARTIFRTGLYVDVKNLSQSMLAETSSCHEIRVNERGYLGRLGKYDFAIALNEQTLVSEYHHLSHEGYFLYNCDSTLPNECEREDVVILGIPLHSLYKENKKVQINETDVQQSHVECCIALGSLAYFLDMNFSLLLSIAVSGSTSMQIQQPPDQGHVQQKIPFALQTGYDYAASTYPQRTCRLSITKSRAVRDSIVVDGNTAIGLGAVYGGATVGCSTFGSVASPVIAQFAHYSRQLRINNDYHTAVHVNDICDAAWITVGAASEGCRAFTALSSPEIAHIADAGRYAYFAEIPTVIVAIQQAPDCTLQTRTMQSDILSCAYAFCGDIKHILFLPCNPTECYTMTSLALDVAAYTKTPVFVICDLDLAENEHVCNPFQWDNSRGYKRAEKEKKSNSYNSPEKYEENRERLAQKSENIESLLPDPHAAFRDPENEFGVLFYGTTTHAAYEAIGRFAAKGIKLNTMRIRAFPFSQEVLDFIRDHRRIFLIEQNYNAQMKKLLINETDVALEKIESLLSYDGLPISVRFIEKQLARML